jgi:hypothetical protein
MPPPSQALTTTRLLFPEDRMTFVFGEPGSPILTPPRSGLKIFTDEAGTTPANIHDLNGVTVPYSTLYTDADSLIPEFYGPAGFVTTLYARVVGNMSRSYKLVAQYIDQLVNMPTLAFGNGPPSSSTGGIGSFYLDRGLSNDPNVPDTPVIYGPRTLSGWPSTGIPLRGPQGIPGSNFIWTQDAPSDTWTMDHPLTYHPSVTLIDSNNEEFHGDLSYPYVGRVIARLGAPETGRGVMT